ncbi:MAG: neutral/alkaline non-lysosomal ceramidase N-terminal domain-containing protein [Gemmataceae bacterium]
MNRIALALCVAIAGAARADEPKGPRAGVAVRVITPGEPLWMAGYASRTKPAQGKAHDLKVKALAIDDPAGATLVLVTTDLIGIPHELGVAVAKDVEKRTKLPRERLMLSSSHTHSGPVVNHSLMDMYPLSPEQTKAVEAYTDRLKDNIVGVVVDALADRKPAKVSYGSGSAAFAINRRQSTDKGFVIGRAPKGLVDHSVPVLRVDDMDGRVKAIAFGYACHNTTLDGYDWNGDYAGYAQLAVEAKHPGAVALFWIGCGADANPDPRRTVELAERHGRELAESVDAVLPKTVPLSGAFAAAYATLPLDLTDAPSRVKLQADTMDKVHAVRQRASRFLKVLDAKGSLPTRYEDYPVQVWQLGTGPVWTALGGEVVVDYALRLKKELAGNRPIWVAGYCNDVMAYIPSERVLKEGGYEADSSMIYYGQPGRWAPGLEQKIVGKVHDLVARIQKP